MNIIEKAIEFASKAHDQQYRKNSTLPYVSHPVTVGFYLMKAGAKEEVVAAGILHDVLEDTAITYTNLVEEFGYEVASLVEGCSEPDKTLSWEKRKAHTIDYLKDAPLAIKQIASADKLHNLRTVLQELEQNGDLVWGKFNRGREQQRWYYDSVYKSLITNLTVEEAELTLAEELKETINKVFYENLD